MNTPAECGAGLGLKPQHYEQARNCEARGLWFEVHPENYMVEGGPRLAWLEAVRERHALSLHGVSLSLAADRVPDAAHLRRLRALADRVQPALVSEHLAWSAWGGRYHPDLLPFPRDAAALSRIAANIACTQEALGRRIAVENPSHYIRIDGHAWSEQDFLAELVRRTGCGLLLDVNNVYVSARNMGFDARAWIDAFPGEAVMEMHLAGYSVDEETQPPLLIDSHDAPVADAVWSLYRYAIDRFGPRPALIERDDHIPAFDTLLAERNAAQSILERAEVIA
ncbi:MNIO family bufferin maturase [Paraburkholderia ferrariae]|uniref:MNIO family bufferin maturase n=1 Tax=Paraburkholderia ferrariae TaxID=386056 RepID=UPI000484EEB5|nr:DUF692 domain-containing protein [Paraburkholderia ferrariae]